MDERRLLSMRSCRWVQVQAIQTPIMINTAQGDSTRQYKPVNELEIQQIQQRKMTVAQVDKFIYPPHLVVQP
jgi:hypothetical protein